MSGNASQGSGLRYPSNKKTIYDRNLNRSKNAELSRAAFAYLFIEMINHAQKHAKDVGDLEKRYVPLGGVRGQGPNTQSKVEQPGLPHRHPPSRSPPYPLRQPARLDPTYADSSSPPVHRANSLPAPFRPAGRCPGALERGSSAVLAVR